MLKLNIDELKKKADKIRLMTLEMIDKAGADISEGHFLLWTL